MAMRTWIVTAAAAALASGALAFEPEHLISRESPLLKMFGDMGTVECSWFACPTNVKVKTREWIDMKGKNHPDGCTAIWEYSEAKVTGQSQLRWWLKKEDPAEKEEYYFAAVDGVRLDPNSRNDEYLDLGQGGLFWMDQSFKWFDWNRRKRLVAPGTGSHTDEGIAFDFLVYRKRGANGAPGPEPCGAFDPVIYNRG